jgi:VanZ family protein
MTQPPQKHSFVSATLPIVLYSLLIFVLSNLKDPPAPNFHLEWGDKINHAIAYGGMMVLAMRASGYLFARQSIAVRIGMALLFCALYGASDEIHQAFVPGRNCDIFDWFADMIGAFLALSGILLTRRWVVTRRIVGNAFVGNPGLPAEL